MRWNMIGRWLLPGGGVALLGLGLVRQFAAPGQVELQRLDQQVKVLAAELDSLRREPLVAADMFADQLPAQIQANALLGDIRAAAERCQIDDLDFEIAGDEKVGPTPSMPAETAPGGPPPAPGTASDRKQDRESIGTVSCDLGVAGGFAAVVRFLGQIERMPLHKTIRGLQLAANGRTLKAQIAVEFHFLNGEQ